MNLPLAKTSDVVVQTLGKDLLIYDLITNKAFQLNETSSIVFNACNGETRFNDLKQKYGFTEDLIYLTLDTLAKENLIVEAYKSKFAGQSRRDVIRKVGLATVVALPMISSIVAPTAAHALSNCSCPSNEPTLCQNGGSYFLGCFPNNPACIAAAFPSGGSPAAPNHCCAGTASVGYSGVTMCCKVTCV